MDIDGVLKPFGHDEGHRIFPSSTLKALAFIVEQLPKAELVLSSTWRVQPSFIDMITNDFREFGGVLCKLDFVDITDPQLHSERQHEIHEWLSRHQQHVRAWIALDDEELLEGQVNANYRQIFEHHVVKTDSHTGMTMDDARVAVSLLRDQLKK